MTQEPKTALSLWWEEIHDNPELLKTFPYIAGEEDLSRGCRSERFPSLCTALECWPTVTETHFSPHYINEEIVINMYLDAYVICTHYFSAAK